MHSNALKDVYIGIGSNLKQPIKQVLSATIELDDLEDCYLVNCSSLYFSRPMGPKDQPPYVNAVAWLKTSLSAHSLLKELHIIENAHGRERKSERWGPRTLDLDILVFDNLCIDNQELTVPHPGIKQREFVLYPLHEVNKNLMIPNLGLVSRLKQKCYANGMSVLNI